jgi:hypothetical protein
MKMCLQLLHLITLVSLTAFALNAQTDLPKAQIVTLALDPQSVTILHLRRGYVSAVRLPEDVSSVVLGDPGGFKAEHSAAEPRLVFFKPITSNPSETNTLITTRTGYEVALSLVSDGKEESSDPVDYVLKYENARSFLIAATQSSAIIGDTKSLAPEAPPTNKLQATSVNDDEALLRQQRSEAPRWEGKQLRVAVGRSAGNSDRMAVAFSVLNSSSRTIELLPPQVQLTGTSKKHGKAIKSEPVPVKGYRLTTRRLTPGARADGVVMFERPAFKESQDRLLLQVAQAAEMDHPVSAAIGFVPAAKGDQK